MIKRITLLLFLSGCLFATEKTFVREYTYQASDYDSKVTSRANALKQVKTLGHTDTSMTKQYTNLDKVELVRAFPDIVTMKNNGIDGKNPLMVPNQGYLELYSNFGFMHVR